ncbi:MAG: ATP-binding protein [Ignavibacteriales bacterium]|nr:MAG: ATP-binding protein [Ignavibacteriales bacterium]
MVKRTKLRALLGWKDRLGRKPLILRGARQVGKTTLVNMFAEEFDHYLYLNLERPEDRNLFPENTPFEQVVRGIFLAKSKPLNAPSTLLFIDEIQNSAVAINLLRYFYEEMPQLHVIAAGSVLESLLNFNESFPVGRVEYEYLHPFTFEEFLLARGQTGLVEALDIYPFPAGLATRMLTEYSAYALVGGMPEAVSEYARTGDIYTVSRVYESLLSSYLDDAGKYASHQNQAALLRHVITSAFLEAGKRITYEGFGKSQYKSREVKEALQILEKAMLIRLLHPSSSVMPPIAENKGRAPKLQVLDTGLLNYFAGIQKEFALQKNLEEVYAGRVAEHLTGQELIAASSSRFHQPAFWMREKSQSSAEIDYIYQHDDLIIPVEVKSGKSGRLRSLHLFLDMCPHPFAVRVYSGELSTEEPVTQSGKRYKLLNLPFYLLPRLKTYVARMVSGG